MIALLAALALQSTPAPAPATCALSEADRMANRPLTFAEFDQGRSDLRHTAWNLSMAGCHAESAAADADYLLYGPELSDRERVVVGWHMAQSLAQAGREAEAAPLVAASAQDRPPEPDAFDWNTYVRGVYAFLIKDRPGLEQALAVLKAAPGQRNEINAGALSRLSTCFDQTYAWALADPACASSL